jgi:hypothetical protein
VNDVILGIETPVGQLVMQVELNRKLVVLRHEVHEVKDVQVLQGAMQPVQTGVYDVFVELFKAKVESGHLFRQVLLEAKYK